MEDAVKVKVKVEGKIAGGGMMTGWYKRGRGKIKLCARGGRKLKTRLNRKRRVLNCIIGVIELVL